MLCSIYMLWKAGQLHGQTGCPPSPWPPNNAANKEKSADKRKEGGGRLAPSSWSWRKVPAINVAIFMLAPLSESCEGRGYPVKPHSQISIELWGLHSSGHFYSYQNKLGKSPCNKPSISSGFILAYLCMKYGCIQRIKQGSSSTMSSVNCHS